MLWLWCSCLVGQSGVFQWRGAFISGTQIDTIGSISASLSMVEAVSCTDVNLQLRENPLPKIVKLGCNPLQTEPGHVALYGKHLLHGQENLWKTTWQSYGRFECELGYLENVHERNRKADQWSDRNHWHKPDQFPRLRWVSTSLLHSRAYQYSTAKVCVFSDCVLCFGKMGDDPVESWKNTNSMVYGKQLFQRIESN